MGPALCCCCLQALASAGFDPVLEFPAQDTTQLSFTELGAILQQQQQQRQQPQQREQQQLDGGAARRQWPQVPVSHREHRSAAVVPPGFLSVDIACVMPTEVVALMQTQGVKGALEALKKQQRHQRQQSTADTISSAPSSTSSNDSNSNSSSTLVAVEVDGPSHVAANCPGHELGATVCRNWLLQQWGWTVLVVPWWQWQVDPDTPGPS